MKKLRELVMGRAAIGYPISQISGTVHTIEPDSRVPESQWHIILYNQIQEIHKKLNEQ